MLPEEGRRCTREGENVPSPNLGIFCPLLSVYVSSAIVVLVLFVCRFKGLPVVKKLGVE